MLSFHLDDKTPLASRPLRDIQRIVGALDGKLGLAGKTICDLGCGPGLYASRFAALGAGVLGVDLSATSIEFARSRSMGDGGGAEYVVADYLSDELGGAFDIVTLIYFDYCALSPADRSSLLTKIRGMLKDGGHFVLDVVSEAPFIHLEETLEIENNLMDRFWSPSDYVGIHRRWVYEEDRICLDHYGIFESDHHFEIYNWMQYFSPDRLVRELEGAGFSDISLYGSLRCEPLLPGSEEIGAIARNNR
jgi:SAM-dependent methyltransferase